MKYFRKETQFGNSEKEYSARITSLSNACRLIPELGLRIGLLMAPD